MRKIFDVIIMAVAKLLMNVSPVLADGGGPAYMPGKAVEHLLDDVRGDGTQFTFNV